MAVCKGCICRCLSEKNHTRGLRRQEVVSHPCPSVVSALPSPPVVCFPGTAGVLACTNVLLPCTGVFPGTAGVLACTSALPHGRDSAYYSLNHFLDGFGATLRALVFFPWDRRRPRLHSRLAPRETVLIIHLTISWKHSARLCAQGKYMQARTPALPG